MDQQNENNTHDLIDQHPDHAIAIGELGGMVNICWIARHGDIGASKPASVRDWGADRVAMHTMDRTWHRPLSPLRRRQQQRR